MQGDSDRPQPSPVGTIFEQTPADGPPDNRRKVNKKIDFIAETEDRTEQLGRDGLTDSDLDPRDHAGLNQMLSQMGMTATATSGALVLCNLIDIRTIAPRFFQKCYQIKVAANNFADIKTYFDYRHAEEISTLLSASEAEARK